MSPRFITFVPHSGDNDNTGMRIWSSGPIAVAWGEDADTTDVGDPYLDLGYTTLPLPEDWMDPVLGMRKTADPTSVGIGAGHVVTFTLGIPAYEFMIDDVVVTDTLPSDWAYVTGSTVITLPDSTVLTGTAANPYITGQNLYWHLVEDMDPNEVMKKNCAVLSYQDMLYISFGSVVEGRELERMFFKSLAQSGIPVLVGRM